MPGAHYTFAFCSKGAAQYRRGADVALVLSDKRRDETRRFGK